MSLSHAKKLQSAVDSPSSLVVQPINKQNASVTQAARHFGVDQVTIRRWIKRGCPCVRRGQRGPGRGALLDLLQVAQWLDLQRGAQWRGMSNAEQGPTVEDTLQRIALAFGEALIRDRVDLRAGINQRDCAEVLFVTFEKCCRKFGKSYPFDQQPQPIRTLMSFL